MPVATPNVAAHPLPRRFPVNATSTMEQATGSLNCTFTARIAQYRLPSRRSDERCFPNNDYIRLERLARPPCAPSVRTGRAMGGGAHTSRGLFRGNTPSFELLSNHHSLPANYSFHSCLIESSESLARCSIVFICPTEAATITASSMIGQLVSVSTKYSFIQGIPIMDTKRYLCVSRMY